MPQFSVNIIEVGISSLLSYLNDMLGEKNILGFTAGERITPHIRYIGIESLSLFQIILVLGDIHHVCRVNIIQHPGLVDIKLRHSLKFYG